MGQVGRMQDRHAVGSQLQNIRGAFNIIQEEVLLSVQGRLDGSDDFGAGDGVRLAVQVEDHTMGEAAPKCW